MKHLFHLSKSERIGTIILICILGLIFGLVIYIRSIQIPAIDATMINKETDIADFRKEAMTHFRLIDSLDSINHNKLVKKKTQKNISDPQSYDKEIPLIVP